MIHTTSCTDTTDSAFIRAFDKESKNMTSAPVVRKWDSRTYPKTCPRYQTTRNTIRPISKAMTLHRRLDDLQRTASFFVKSGVTVWWRLQRRRRQRWKHGKLSGINSLPMFWIGFEWYTAFIYNMLFVLFVRVDIIFKNKPRPPI